MTISFSRVGRSRVACSILAGRGALTRSDTSNLLGVGSAF